MNPKLTLARQPVPVLVALFNSIAYKRLSDGSVTPLCVKICEILNERGFDIQKLNFKGAKCNPSPTHNEKNKNPQRRIKKNGQ